MKSDLIKLDDKSETVIPVDKIICMQKHILKGEILMYLSLGNGGWMTITARYEMDTETCKKDYEKLLKGINK